MGANFFWGGWGLTQKSSLDALQLVKGVFGDGGEGIWGWWRGYLELALGFGVFALGFG